MASRVLSTSNMLFCIIKCCTGQLHHAQKCGTNSGSVNYSTLSLTWHAHLLILLICAPRTFNLLCHQGLQSQLQSSMLLDGPSSEILNNISAPALQPNCPSTAENWSHTAMHDWLGHWSAKGHWRRVTLTCIKLLQQGSGKDPVAGPRYPRETFYMLLFISQQRQFLFSSLPRRKESGPCSLSILIWNLSCTPAGTISWTTPRLPQPPSPPRHCYWQSAPQISLLDCC